MSAPAAERAAVRAFEVHFLPAACRVRHMRQITAAHLRLWHLTALVDTATLAVSELVTNSIRHGEGHPVGLRVTCSAHELRIAVTDGCPTPARLRSADDTAESGRGLLLIAFFTKDWGVSPDGLTTWCAFAIPARRP
ncbi:ATP-binding protein [Streptomyces sp. x-80]|uniref:ATP-binding protein n=1 Tax=Streptomyces sp. x-80 TaxID=2789282 RepID=UPI00397FBE81